MSYATDKCIESDYSTKHDVKVPVLLSTIFDVVPDCSVSLYEGDSMQEANYLEPDKPINGPEQRKKSSKLSANGSVSLSAGITKAEESEAIELPAIKINDEVIFDPRSKRQMSAKSEYDELRKVNEDPLGATEAERCMPVVQLCNDNFFKAMLPDGEDLIVLFDTGSSVTLLNRSIIERSHYLRSLKEYPAAKPRKLLVGSGEIMAVDTCLDVTMRVDNMTLAFTCFVYDAYAPFQLVLGSDVQEQYRAIFDTFHHTLLLQIHDVELRLAQTVVLPPGQTIRAPVETVDGSQSYTGPFEITLNAAVAPYLFRYIYVDFQKGKTILPLVNNTDKPVRLHKGLIVGFINLRACLDPYVKCKDVQVNEAQLTMQFKVFPFPGTRAFTVLDGDNMSVDNCQSIIDKGAEITDTSAEGLRHAEPEFKSQDERRKFRLSKYPWLNENDKRLEPSLEQVLESQVCLDKSRFTESEKRALIDMLKRNSAAFSLFDEIGRLKRYEIDLTTELMGDPQFCGVPYITTSEDIQFVEAEMLKLVQLGIFERGLGEISSSIFLVRRTPTSKPRIVTDLRKLNSHFKLINRPSTTVRSFCMSYGAKNHLYTSTCDVKAAYHTVPVTESSKKYLGVVTSRKGASLQYCVLPMGFLNSCSYFLEVVYRILSELPVKYRQNFASYFDDLIFFTETAEEHLELLDLVFALFARHGLNFALEKCHFCPLGSIDFLGYEIDLTGSKPTLRVTSSRVDALLALKTPESKRDIKRVLGCCIYISMFLKNFQQVVYPLTKLLKKNVEFQWSDEQEQAWQTLKQQFVSLPALYFPNETDPFIVAADASRSAVGGVLFQNQLDETGERKLVPIAFTSRVLSNISSELFSVSELEAYALLVVFQSFRVFLGTSPFYALTDHKALVHIFQQSVDFATPRLRRIYWRLLEYQFVLKYVSGQDHRILLADLMSRHPNHLWHQNEAYIVPISLRENEVCENDTLRGGFNVQDNTRAAQSEVHKAPDSVKVAANSILFPVITRAQAKKARDAMHKADEDSDIDREHVGPAENVPVQERSECRGHRDGPAGIGAEALPRPSAPTKVPSPTKPRTDPKPLSGSAHREEVEVQIRESSDREFRRVRSESQYLSDENPTPDVLTRMPHQRDLIPLIQKYTRSVLSTVMVPFTIDTLITAQRGDTFLRSIFEYIQHGKLSGSNSQMQTVIRLAEHFAIVQGVLSYITYSLKAQRVTVQVCLPESLVFSVLEFLHENQLGGHVRMTRLYMLTRTYFYIRNLYQHVIVFVRCCLTCQRLTKGLTSGIERPYLPRILGSDAAVFDTVHMDLLVLPEAQGYCYCLVIVCELSRFIIAVPLRTKKTDIVARALVDHLILPYFCPRRIICDKEPSFMSALLMALQKAMHIDTHFVKPMGHASNMAERAIKTLTQLLRSTLEGDFYNWPMRIVASAKVHNMTPLTETGYSPTFLVFLREERVFEKMNLEPLSLITVSYDQYVKQMQDKLQTIKNRFIETNNRLKEKQMDSHYSRIGKIQTFEKNDLVLLLAPRYTALTEGHKLKIELIGPLYVYEDFDVNSKRLATLENKILPGVYHVSRLKPAELRGKNGSILRTVQQFREQYNACLVSLTPIEDREIEPVTHVERANSQNAVLTEVNNSVNTGLSYSVINCDTQDYGILVSFDQEIDSHADPAKSLGSPENYHAVQMLGEMPWTCHIGKYRFKEGQLQVFIKVSENHKLTNWYSFATECLLLPLLNEIVERPVSITGSLKKFQRQAKRLSECFDDMK